MTRQYGTVHRCDKCGWTLHCFVLEGPTGDRWWACLRCLQGVIARAEVERAA